MTATHAKYIWSDDAGTGLNRYVLFRRTFELSGDPTCAVFHVFADTRYRLTVNGAVVGHGPGRFFVFQPEYDAWDLTPFLRAGSNVIALVVNSYGCYTYHSQYSHGGLIAWGEATDSAGKTVSLETNDAWRALPSPAHIPETAHLSFVLNPGELIDARNMPVGWDTPDFDDAAWPQAVPLADQSYWGELVPRNIPLLDEREVLPRRRSGTWAAQYAEPEDVYSFIIVGQDGTKWRAKAPSLAWTYVHSPRGQQVTFGAWAGQYWVNGQRVEPVRRTDVHVRNDFTAQLKEGWNSLQVRGPLTNGAWEFYLGLPRKAGLSLSAEREADSAHTFLLAGPWEGELQAVGENLPLPLGSPDDLPADLGPWRKWERGRSANSAFVERAWKRTTPIPGSPSLQVSGADYAPTVGSDTLVLTFDFGGAVLGRPILDMTAPAGTVVDLMYAEKLEDGLPVHFHRYEVRMAERYIAREGRQTWQTFHPRGFRWLEVLVRGDLGRFRLHKVSATRANYPVRQLGSFECSDPTLNAIWELGCATQFACMEDAYLDCPRRERGSYPGDNLVQFHTVLAAFGDAQLMRRSVQQAFFSQDESGLMSHCAHSPSHVHPDYSAITAQTLWVYYARTGDAEFLHEMKPRLVRLMEALEGFEIAELGLLDGSHLQPYLDISYLDREGVSCTLNCQYQRAFHDAARVMAAIGDDDLAERYRSRADSLAAAIRQHYWDAERRVFVDRLKADKPDTGPSAPGNILPLLYEIADDEQTPHALQYVVDAMLHNFRRTPPMGWTDCNLSAYFSFYGLGVLYGFGKAREAEQYMRTCWGIMLDKGACTAWEHFRDNASQCHAWASSPTHYLSTCVLGVRFPEPGNPNRVRVEPQPGSLSWAEGVYPHAAGPIHVRWEMKGDRLILECDAPSGVEIETAGGV